MANSPAGEIRDSGLIPESGKSLEVGMATHSNILPWRNLWTEEPGRLQSIGSQRVEHNRSDSVHATSLLS